MILWTIKDVQSIAIHDMPQAHFNTTGHALRHTMYLPIQKVHCDMLFRKLREKVFGLKPITQNIVAIIRDTMNSKIHIIRIHQKKKDVPYSIGV